MWGTVGDPSRSGIFSQASRCSESTMGSPSDLVLTREQCRAVDHFTIHTLGIPGILLMENAGRNAAEQIVKWVDSPRTDPAKKPAARAAIICGKGNNGGDGFVIARHLLRHGWDTTIYLA